MGPTARQPLPSGTSCRATTCASSAVLSSHHAADDDRPDDFILARLDDTQPILDGMAKLRRKYPNAMALEMPNRNTQAAGQRDFDLQQVTERELFTGFAQAMRPDQP